MPTASVAIIGGGVIGCSIAYHLTERGITDLTLFERARLASGATGICPGGIRQQFETEADCRLAQRALSFYENINARLGHEPPFFFERSGYMFLADSPDVLARFRRNVEMQNRLGISSRLLTRVDIAALLPHARLDGVLGGSFCGEDGFIEDCDGVTHAFARVAKARGARVRYEEVADITGLAGGWRLRTGSGTTDAGAVIIAAGADSVGLAAGVGLRLPIVAERRRLAYTVPAAPGIAPPLVAAFERGVAFKQLTNGVFYLGWLGDRPEIDDLTFVERSLAAAATLLPLLHDLPVRRIVAGTYDTTPDHRAILGTAPGLDHLYLAAGFSGHGFMVAPAVGDLLAGLVAGDAPDPLLEAFSPDRFGTRTADEGLQI